MIEPLANLLESANVNRINFSIQSADSPDKINVVVQAIFHPPKNDAKEEQIKLRAALSKPLSISGSIGEVDAQIESILFEHLDKTEMPVCKLTTNSKGIEEAIKESSNSSKEEPKEKDSESEEDADSISELDFTSNDVESL